MKLLLVVALAVAVMAAPLEEVHESRRAIASALESELNGLMGASSIGIILSYSKATVTAAALSNVLQASFGCTVDTNKASKCVSGSTTIVSSLSKTAVAPAAATFIVISNPPAGSSFKHQVFHWDTSAYKISQTSAQVGLYVKTAALAFGQIAGSNYNSAAATSPNCAGRIWYTFSSITPTFTNAALTGVSYVSASSNAGALRCTTGFTTTTTTWNYGLLPATNTCGTTCAAQMAPSSHLLIVGFMIA